MKKVIGIFIGHMIPKFIVACAVSYFIFKHEEETEEDITEIPAWDLVEKMSPGFWRYE